MKASLRAFVGQMDACGKIRPFAVALVRRLAWGGICQVRVVPALVIALVKRRVKANHLCEPIKTLCKVTVWFYLGRASEARRRGDVLERAS